MDRVNWLAYDTFSGPSLDSRRCGLPPRRPGHGATGSGLTLSPASPSSTGKNKVEITTTLPVNQGNFFAVQVPFSVTSMGSPAKGGSESFEIEIDDGRKWSFIVWANTNHYSGNGTTYNGVLFNSDSQSNQAGKSYATSASSGALGFISTGQTITAYFNDGSGWRQLGNANSATGSTGNISLSLRTTIHNSGSLTVVVPSVLYSTDPCAYKALMYPGATDTLVQAINDAGQVVGYYDMSGPGTHGFSRKGTGWSTVDYPGAAKTYVYGINNPGEMVGAYDDSGGNTHGFSLIGSSSATLDYPGAQGTYVKGINDAGQMVGYYYDNSGTSHGFLLSGSKWNTLDCPGAIKTFPNAINKSGQIVGCFVDSYDTRHGFSLVRSTWTTVAPTNEAMTVNGIGNKGQMVGSDEQTHLGFSLSGSSRSTIAYPNAELTLASGVNSVGQIVGYGSAEAWATGFLATPFSLSTGPAARQTEGYSPVPRTRTFATPETLRPSPSRPHGGGHARGKAARTQVVRP